MKRIKYLFIARRRLYTTILTVCCILYIAVCLSACYAMFRASEIEYKTYPVNKQDTIH